MAYLEGDCLQYAHASGPLDIGCDFEAVDKFVLSNFTCSSPQYTDFFLIHNFQKCFLSG
jgi:hypothetical protein